MNKSRRRATLLISLFLATIFLSACATQNSQEIQYSSGDVMFAEMMIPHHQQAIEMSELALAKSSNPDILKLAKEIKGAQTPEIDQMKSWSGVRADSHMGHAMMGMLNDDEISALREASGAEFDRLFLVGMIKHHEGAIDMAEMIVDSGNSEVAALGKSIIQVQNREIAYMKELLKK